MIRLRRRPPAAATTTTWVIEYGRQTTYGSFYPCGCTDERPGEGPGGREFRIPEHLTEVPICEHSNADFRVYARTTMANPR